MFSSRFLEELQTQCPFLTKLPEAWQQALAVALQKTCDKLGLVTREEFDIQVNILSRTQAKIAVLESRLAEKSTGI